MSTQPDWQAIKSDVEAGGSATNDQVMELGALIRRQVELEDRIASLNVAIETQSEELKKLQETIIPEVMLGLGIESFTVTGGFVVSMAKFYNAKIPEERKREALEWLRKNGHDDIVKNQVVVAFGKGEDAMALKLLQDLLKKKFECNHIEGVHPQTLKAFVKEQVESKIELPQDLFGIYIGNRSKVTRPSKKGK
jgi:hypothetical protein